jgi:hypothetical protein
MIGLHKQRRRVGEWFVLGKPRGLGMPVRAYDRQAGDTRIKGSGNLTGCFFGRKQTVFMEQHGFYSTLDLEFSRLYGALEVRPEVYTPSCVVIMDTFSVKIAAVSRFKLGFG